MTQSHIILHAIFYLFSLAMVEHLDSTEKYSDPHPQLYYGTQKLTRKRAKSS